MVECSGGLAVLLDSDKCEFNVQRIGDQEVACADSGVCRLRPSRMHRRRGRYRHSRCEYYSENCCVQSFHWVTSLPPFSLSGGKGVVTHKLVMGIERFTGIGTKLMWSTPDSG